MAIFVQVCIPQIDVESLKLTIEGGGAFRAHCVGDVATESIRDVIAFPKTQKASCLLTDASSLMSDAQLRELHIRVRLPQSEPPKHG